MGAWADTVLPEGTRVGGVRLYPLTLGHAALLQRLGNGFADPLPTSTGLGDMVVLAWVLSRTWDRAALTISRRSTRWWILVRTSLWQRRQPEILAGLLQYHLRQWQTPEVEYRKGRRVERGTEHLHALYLHRRRAMHEDHETALGVPVRRAQLDLLADYEQEGALTLCGPKLDRLQKLAAEHADWDRSFRQQATTAN
jgi:hypothetical protein